MNYVFTGPESSGKTTLALVMSEKTGGEYVPEFAREYIQKLNRPYEQKDLLQIAKEQFRLHELAKKRGSNLLFDTDLLTIKIWSEEKYKDCDPWILAKLNSNKDFIYVLCKPDFPWQFDPQRENPTDQDRLFERYEDELKKLQLNYVIVQGSLKERLQMLISF